VPPHRRGADAAGTAASVRVLYRLPG